MIADHVKPSPWPTWLVVAAILLSGALAASAITVWQQRRISPAPAAAVLAPRPATAAPASEPPALSPLWDAARAEALTLKLGDRMPAAGRTP